MLSGYNSTGMTPIRENDKDYLSLCVNLCSSVVKMKTVKTKFTMQ